MFGKALIRTMVVLLLLAPFTLLANAAGGEESIPHGRWWSIPKVAEELNLSEEEKQSLDEVSIAFRRKAIDLKSELERERLELDILMEKEPLDESAILGQFKKMEAARSAASMERFGVLLEVRKILGLERYQLLKEKHKDFGKKRRSGGRADRAKPK